ncbi:hypothetical protein MY11210_006144 [Beauveria gryllotalpidicola]
MDLRATEMDDIEDLAPVGHEPNIQNISSAVKLVLEALGEDTGRDGLRKTPERFAKAIVSLTSGYNLNPISILKDAIFEEECHGLVVVRNISFSSLCEHHLLPFFGKAHIGYIPNGRVVGLSKPARVVNVFAKRLQLQERLTRQVAQCLFDVVQPRGPKDGGRRRFRQPLSALNLEQHDECFALVFAQANNISKCIVCRSELADRFSVPTFWWKLYCKRANGYFGSQDIITDREINAGLMTWARFLVKFVQPKNKYTWTKLNILTHAPAANNQIMLVFDAVPTTRTMLLDSLMDSQRNDETIDPFWIYYRILNDVVALHDESIWSLRNQVRNIECSSPKGSNDESTGKGAGERSKPNYRELHDLARHAIHIAETTSTTVNTIKGIHAAHREYMNIQSAEGLAFLRAKSIQKRVQDRLLLYDQVAVGLQNRAEATKDRLHNEIQLSFNTVTQDDAATTIQISLIAQTDSRVMRMIAYLTLGFLPATFISAIFSTSFFNFNPEHQKYSVSSMFWIYWVFAALVTVGMFYMFRRWGPSQTTR